MDPHKPAYIISLYAFAFCGTHVESETYLEIKKCVNYIILIQCLQLDVM